MIEIYTDGASSGNPGPGGYGVILRSGQHYKELSAGYRKPLITAWSCWLLSPGWSLLNRQISRLQSSSDSKYVIDAIEKRWVNGWVAKGFAGKKNKDLWMRYLNIAKMHQIKFVWVRGHNGHPENERCDQLAVAAGKQKRPFNRFCF